VQLVAAADPRHDGPVSWASWRAWFRELLGIVPSLDLHGYGVRDALLLCERFLHDAQDSGEPVVRIIYGKGQRSPGGRGVLREVIPHWLDHEGAALVERYQRLPDSSGSDGSVRVWIRSRTPGDGDLVDSPRAVP